MDKSSQDMLSNCVKHKPDAWWLVIFFFVRLLLLRDLDKLKSKLEIIMEKALAQKALPTP